MAENAVLVFSHVEGDYLVHLKAAGARLTLCGVPAFETPLREKRKVTCRRCQAAKPTVLGGAG